MRRFIFLLALSFQTPLLAAEIPWPEHPRPDFQRSPWINLNGKWKFAFDPENVGEKEEWFRPGVGKLDREIVVPFPWESKLSGIGDTKYQGVAWYAREITLPYGDDWKDTEAWLVVGACDFMAKVWVNGQSAGEHVGGYLPFELNLSKFANPSDKATVVIRAEDRTDPQQPTGKQVGWYTRNSGIWQTVYLEGRGRNAIQSLRCLPNTRDGSVVLKMRVGNRQFEHLIVSSPDSQFETVDIEGSAQTPEVEATIKIKSPKLWSPDAPSLYRIKLELSDVGGVMSTDEVETYVGLREVSIQKAPGRDYQYIYLNGKPIYLMGLLHQSFHPDGIYQYPDDATMRSDYELCKKTGINFVRIHIKTPVPRELYWADKLGVMVMQDLPNFWQHTEQARRWYEQMLEGAIARDFNHPSIFSWVNFNESWGLDDGEGYTPDRQKWVESIYQRTKKLDPTRLVEDNSPCKYDHVTTDINSWHFYINDYEESKKHIQEVVDKTQPGSKFNYIGGYSQSDAPLINSEYGGISAGHGDQDVSWCFKYHTNELRKHDKICGYIYTELSDIEWEHNGYVNYDRSPKEFGYDDWFPGFSLKDLNSPDFVVIDAPPMIELKPGEEVQVPISISHWSDHEAKDLKIRWAFVQMKPGTPSDAGARWSTHAARWKPFEVVEQPPIELSVSERQWFVGALRVELVDGEHVLSRNYVNVRGGTHPPGLLGLATDLLQLTFSPSDDSECTFRKSAPAFSTRNSLWRAGEGTGHLQYELQLPESVDLNKLSRLIVTAEVAARSSDAKLDWPDRRTPHDHAQTDVKKWPSTLRISVNGVELQTSTLPDDPADARGALSHAIGLQGGYGYQRAANADGDKLRQIVREAGSDRLLRIRFEVPADAEHKGGLTIYGAGTGCHGLPPSVILMFGQDFRLPGLRIEQSLAVNRASEKLAVPIATAEAGGHEWSLTIQQPGEDWTAMDFDDSGWKKGRGGFGTRETPNAIIGTRWKTADIWLRTQIDIDDPAQIEAASWRLYHDEDVEIYLNGKPVLKRDGFVTQYENVPLDRESLKQLRKGRNVIAVHCHQTDGGQNIDLGLTMTRKNRK